MLENRKLKIAEGLAAAENAQHEQELARKDALQHIKEGKEQAAIIISRAQKRSAEIIDDAKVEAKAEGVRLITVAEAEIEQEKQRAKEALREQVVTITMTAAAKIIKKEINAESHSAILNDAVGQL